jgi:DNA-directed RNA polymerase specialized sigma subunit
MPNKRNDNLPLRVSTSPATRAMLDLLSDGNRHPIDEVLYAGICAALGTDYNKCIAEGKRARRGRPASIAEYAYSGARSFARNNLMIARRNKRVRSIGTGSDEMIVMPKALAFAWATARRAENRKQPRDVVTKQPFGKVAEYAGISEWEGWAYAPLTAHDVAHVRPSLRIPLDELRAAFPGWEVNEAPDGLVTVSAHPGAPVKEVVTSWFTERDYHHDGVRDAKNVRRRNLSDLNQNFLSDLMSKSIPFARGLVASRYGASMQRLVGDYDDIEGYVTLWVIELAQSFDSQLGRPFGTWITNQIPRKVQDLNRASHGRTASDAEIKHARARASLEAEYGRTPTNEELRAHLGLSKEEMSTKRRHLNTLASLRTTTPLDQGPDAPEIVVIDEAPSPEDRALTRERSQQITLSLLAASGTFDPEAGAPKMTKPLGFLVTYLMMWDDWVKGDLISLAGCADRKVTEEVEQVHTELARLLSGIKESHSA